jgi:hypothetical protein
MPDRTTETTVTFRHPFTLSGVNGPQPAGTYKIIIDEAEIVGLSFLAYRRTATTLCLPAIGVQGNVLEHCAIGFEELTDAVEADGSR